MRAPRAMVVSSPVSCSRNRSASCAQRGSSAYSWRSVTVGREAWRHRIETDEKWEHLSRSTDHDAAGDAWQRQRGSSLPDVRG